MGRGQSPSAGGEVQVNTVSEVSARGDVQCRDQRAAALLRTRFQKPARRARRSDKGHCRLRERIGENWRNRLSCCMEGSRGVWRPVHGAKDGSYVPKADRPSSAILPAHTTNLPPLPPHHRAETIDRRSASTSSRLASQTFRLRVGLGAPTSQSSHVSNHPMRLDAPCAPRRPHGSVEGVSCCSHRTCESQL